MLYFSFFFLFCFDFFFMRAIKTFINSAHAQSDFESSLGAHVSRLRFLALRLIKVVHNNRILYLP